MATPADTAVRKAVLDLRHRLGQTQQQFATSLGIAISTAVRYKLTRTPQGKMLAKLARLAIENGFDEEAYLFLDLLFKELGFTPFELGGLCREMSRAECVVPK
jgi:transcriptional regulator with XRE-family HTH domain